MSSTLQNSRLLQLPAELRNQIYNLVLHQDDQVVLYHWFDAADRCTEGKPPELLKVCQQIRNEATQMYYAQTVFRTDWWTCQTTLLPWLKALGPQRRSMIRHIQFDTTFFGKCDETELTAVCSAELQRYMQVAKRHGVSLPYEIFECRVITRMGSMLDMMEALRGGDKEADDKTDRVGHSKAVAP